MVDQAIICGRVAEEPHYVHNEGKQRCVFSLAMELKERRDPSFKGEDKYEYKFTTVTVVVTPDITDLCLKYLRKDDTVMAVGEFGFHKGNLKMRASGLSLPSTPKVDPPTPSSTPSSPPHGS